MGCNVIEMLCNQLFFYAPAIFNGVWVGVGGGDIVSPLSAHTPVPSVRPSRPAPSRPVRPVCNTFGFRAISLERLGVFDRNFIHRYIIIKCRPSSI